MTSEPEAGQAAPRPCLPADCQALRSCPEAGGDGCLGKWGAGSSGSLPDGSSLGLDQVLAFLISQLHSPHLRVLALDGVQGPFRKFWPALSPE